MTSPTKLNTGNSRPVTKYTVNNSESRDVERSQLNRILSELDSRLTTVEDDSGSDSTGTSYEFNAAQFFVSGDMVSIREDGIGAAEIDFSTFDTDNITEGSSNLYFTDARAIAALQPELDELYYVKSTGLKYGGVLSINGGDNTKFDLSAGSGTIVDYWTDLTQPPVITEVTWGAFTAQTVTNLGTATVSHILIDSAGAIVQQTTFPTPDQRREYIYIGQLGHANKTTLGNAVNIPDILHSPLSQLRDIAQGIGAINEGLYVTANGANLSIDISAGAIVKLGGNFRTNPQDPSHADFTATSPTTFRRRTQTGNGANGVTTIDPGNYDVAGTITAIGSTKATNQRVYKLVNGNVIVMYGQTLYNNLAAAISAVQSENFVELQNVEDTAILIGVISVMSNATDLSDDTQARFLPATKFGETVGSAGGIPVSTLQTAYDNSVTPEIVTNSTLGAVTFQRGSAADTDAVIEVRNAATTTTFSVSGNGLATAASLNVTGNSTFGDAAGDTVTFNAAAWTLANNITVTGTWANLGSVTTIDINGGTIDGAAIGSSSRSSGAFTTLSATGNTDLGQSGSGGSAITTIRGYSLSSFGTYGQLIFSADTGYTAGARQWLVTNAYTANSFALIRSVDATTPPTLSATGTISSGSLDLSISNTGTVTVHNELTAAADIVMTGSGATIRKNTADAADNDVLHVTGGGALSINRSAYISLYGNEHASQPGNLNIVPGSTGFARLYNASAVETLRSTGAGIVVNEDGTATVDFRVEGDTLTHMLFCDASPATENIALVATGAPNWQSMDRGLFIGDVSTAPTTQAASGLFLWSASGSLTTNTSLTLTSDISPAQLVAGTDNWNPTGLSTARCIRLSTDASRNLTGIVAQAGGREIILSNIGTQDCVLVHDATSTAANRFLCPGSANFTLNTNDSVIIRYDSTSSRWRVIAA